MRTIFQQSVIGDSLWERFKDLLTSDWAFILSLLAILGLRVWGIIWALQAIAAVQPSLVFPLIVLLVLSIGMDFK